MQSTQLWSESIDWVAGEQNIPAEGLRCTAKHAIASLIKLVQCLLMKIVSMVFVLSLMNLNVQLHRAKVLYFIRMKFA